MSPLASKRSPAPRRQVVAPEERNARHSVATEWAHSPCPFTTALGAALARSLAEAGRVKRGPGMRWMDDGLAGRLRDTFFNDFDTNLT